MLPQGLRWALLKDRPLLSAAVLADLEVLISKTTTARTARAWVYKEQLPVTLARKQISVSRAFLQRWCSCLMSFTVAPIQDVSALLRKYLEDLVAYARARQTNGFLKELNGLLHAAKWRACGFTRLSTLRTVIFMIASKLNFRTINPHDT